MQAYNLPCYRSSRSEVYLGKVVMKLYSKFTGEHRCKSVIPIKLLCNFTEITFQHGCSPVNLLHIFRTLFYKKKNTSGGLLLLLKGFPVYKLDKHQFSKPISGQYCHFILSEKKLRFSGVFRVYKKGTLTKWVNNIMILNITIEHFQIGIL